MKPKTPLLIQHGQPLGRRCTLQPQQARFHQHRQHAGLLCWQPILWTPPGDLLHKGCADQLPQPGHLQLARRVTPPEQLHPHASGRRGTDQAMKAGAEMLHLQPGGMGEAGLEQREGFGDPQGGRTLQR